jgi:GTPase
VERKISFLQQLVSHMKVSKSQFHQFHRIMMWCLRRGISSHTSRFYDCINIQVRGGQGGFGCVSFDEHKRPNGGNGGIGGDVLIRSADAMKDLNLPARHFKGGKGTNGSRDGMNGRKGNTVVVNVPVGTLVKRVSYPSDFDEDDYSKSTKTIIADLDSVGSELLVAKGGMGGAGNRGMHGRRQRKGDKTTKPKGEKDGKRETEEEDEEEQIEIHHTRGEHGEHDYLELELKLIADVGLVGFPNAGKSTLLRSLSRAKPKVANYPFTTLRPNLGAIQYKDGTQIFLADIPGIIDGAHQNRGLGHDFLRHIERVKMVVYVLDGSGDYGRRDPCEDFRILQDELRLYSSDMISRPSLVAINKMDLVLESKESGMLNALGDFNEQFETMRERIQDMSYEFTGNRVPVVAMSGMTGLRVSDLALAIRGIAKPDSL